jgi:uncharacterized membrane protein
MPDALHVHLMISHLPVVGVFIGIALLVWGFVRRSDDVKQASLGLFVLCAVGAAVTFATGEPAEERVERIAGVDKVALERHEDAGEAAAVVTYILGGASVAGLLWVWRVKRGARAVFVTAMLVALGTALLLARAANLGGQIRHTELGTGAVAAGNDDHDD